MTEPTPTGGTEPGPPPVAPPPPAHPPRQAHGSRFRQLQELTGRQRGMLLGGVLAVVMALVAGLLAMGHGSDADTQQTGAQQNLQPFEEAVDSLADAPGLRYKDTSAHGITDNEITVTASGSQFGTTSSGQNDNGRDVLRIGGKTFMRWQVDPAPREKAEKGEKAPPSEWAVGMDDGSELTDEALARTTAPSKLAAVLDKALADLKKSPPSASDSNTSGTSGKQPLRVNKTPALGVDTSAGRLLVTKTKPHRVLRLEAYDPLKDLSEMRDQLERGEAPTTPLKVTTGPLASGDGEGMDLDPIVADEAVAKMFDTLVEYADQLKNATDRGITFTLDGAGEMDCSSSGCTATQKFTGEVSSIAREERVTTGEVTAVLSAAFSIDGKPAGKCTSPQRTFPLRSNKVSGTLKCSNSKAGPLYSSVAARIKAQAETKAKACGCKVRLTYPLRANTLVDARALAKAEAKKLAKQAKLEREAAECATPHSFPSGTQVLLADGTTRAIEDVRVGDRVTASDPQVERTTARQVTNTFTTEDDKDFTRLTLTTDQGPATVTATDNHPFWLEDDQRWKDAGDLQVGDELRAPNGTSVAVAKVRHQQGPQRTHDLTVNDLHTYYVLAGETPVLVHNCGKGDGYLYRGVPNGHPKYDDALEGRAVPHGGHSDPGRHAGGNTDSDFTSWTHDYEDVALDTADELGPGGIVMRIPHSSVPAGRDVQIHGTAHEVYEESEHALRGVIEGAEISIDRGPWRRPGG